MYKWAFFVNGESLTPKNYRKVLIGEDFYGLVCGVNSLGLALETAGNLAEKGFNEINLCGDFDEEMAGKVKDALGNKEIIVCRETYSETEMKKLNALTELNPWGIIIPVGPGWDKDNYYVMESEECDTHIACVNGLEEAIAAAKKMVNEGVKFMELAGNGSKEIEKMSNQEPPLFSLPLQRLLQSEG